METIDITPNWENVAKFLAEAYVGQNFAKGNFEPMISMLEALQHLALDREAYQRVIHHLQQRTYTNYRIELLDNVAGTGL